MCPPFIYFLTGNVGFISTPCAVTASHSLAGAIQ
jgi:hypothetical protein